MKKFLMAYTDTDSVSKALAAIFGGLTFILIIMYAFLSDYDFLVKP